MRKNLTIDFLSQSIASPKYPHGITAVERFWSYVDPGADDECWPWQGGTWNGYGRLFIAGQVYLANRLTYAIHHGHDLPEGLHACHTCDNPPCCNPHHIYAGTPKQNFADALDRNRIPLGERRRGSKLCADQIVEIRRRFGEGESKKSLARSFGVTPRNIKLIVENLMWTHVSPRQDEIA